MTRSLLTAALRPAGPKLGKIYIRVSDTSGRGNDLVSPEIQEMKAREKAAIEGITIIGSVVELDLSGRKFNNRKIAEIIEEVKRGEYEYVVLWKWSRFGRNLKDSLIHLDLLERAGGEALSATEPGDSRTMMGKFSRNQMLLIAELQSDMIGESWKETFQLRLLKGLPATGKTGWGYHMVEEEVDGRLCRVPAPHPERGPILAEVYTRWTDEGEYMRSIVRDMQARGVRTANGKVIVNERWFQYMDVGMAAGLLRVVKPGRMNLDRSLRFDDYDWLPGIHDNIIELDTWEAYKERRLANIGKKWPGGKAKYSVSTMLICALCKRGMVAVGKGTNGGARFQCKLAQTKECRGTTILLHIVEDGVRMWLRQRAGLIMSDEEVAARLAKDHQVGDEGEVLEREITELDRKLANLLDLAEDGTIDKVTYKERKEEREEERAMKERRLNEIRRKASQNLPASFYLNLDQAWDSLTADRRRQGLKKVIDFIVVYPPGREGGRTVVVPYEKLANTAVVA